MPPAHHHRPTPIVEAWEWQLRGLCRGVDSAVFFHPDGERGRARARREAQAKALCRRCPVLAECREHALNMAEPFGIWGALSASERAAYHRGYHGLAG
jgi:WhiB family redox-sensing transcriptional regulator